MEGWTDNALKVFGRHRGTTGTAHPDQKAMIALNEVSVHHIGQYLGAELGVRGGVEGWLESRDHTEHSQRPPHWAIFGGRVGGEGWGKGVTGKPWSHCMRSASTLGYSWGKRWGLGRRGDQKAMIALNEVCIHTRLQLGAEVGVGEEGWPESHDRTERGQHPHWATVGGRMESGRDWGDRNAMITLNCIRSASTGGYIWWQSWGDGAGGGGGEGDQKAMITLNKRKSASTGGYIWGQSVEDGGGGGDQKATITPNWMRSASTGGCIWRQSGGDGVGVEIRKPWSHWTRPAAILGYIGRMGEGGREGWPKSHDYTERGHHPHWATFRGRVGKGWREGWPKSHDCTEWG